MFNVQCSMFGSHDPWSCSREEHAHANAQALPATLGAEFCWVRRWPKGNSHKGHAHSRPLFIKAKQNKATRLAFSIAASIRSSCCHPTLPFGMSSRQLRKLQQQRELQQAQAKLQAKAETEEEEEGSEEEPVVPTKSKASLFANLATLEDEGDNEPLDEKEVESQHELRDPEPSPARASKAKKSKKKKKTQAKNKAKEALVDLEKHGNSADEIDAALRELNIKQASNASVASSRLTLDPEYERVCKLLGITSQHLKVANEMRNLFGKTAIENHDDAGGPIGRGARRRQQRGHNQQVDLETALKGHHAPGKGLSELTLRRNNFIQGKEEWPKGTTGGLTMAVAEGKSDDGTMEFKYVHDQSYQTLQQTFQGFVEMGDPQNLIGLLVRNRKSPLPFHVDAILLIKPAYHISLLIQVSKIAKDQGDHALSSDLLERALFTFGRAASSTFNTKLSQGKVRLAFARPENRELWLAGYQYIKSLVMKGTYGTALEWAKLLLTLNPASDPYCMRLMIHHLALRAHQFDWLLNLYDSQWGKEWQNTEEGHSPAIYHVSPSLAFAALQLRDGQKCRELLSDSMNKVPWLFFRLFKELDLDAPPSVWGIEPRTDAETLFTEIYVLQTKDLWNTPEATSLLMEVAHTISKVNQAKIPLVDNSEMTLDVVRFVYLDNTPALMALAPSRLLHRSNNSDADPLPPDDNIISYDSQRLALQDGGGRRAMQDDFFNPLAAIARLMPRGVRFHDTRERGARGADDDDDEEEMDEDIEAMVQREIEEATERGETFGEGRPPPGLIQRILTSIFGGGGEESENEGGETDEDMPGLIDNEDAGEYEESESDDEMPDLIPQ